MPEKEEVQSKWANNQGHFHPYWTNTSVDFYHNHGMQGDTSRNPGGNNDGHVHIIKGITSYNYGHTHEYLVTTGPAIPYAGSHIHQYYGGTTINGEPPHTHRFNDYTGQEQF